VTASIEPDQSARDRVPGRAESHKFSFGLGPGGLPGPELAVNRNALAEFARAAEDCGYTNVHVGDHFDDRPGPMAATALLISATTKVRVGALVLANDFRNPATVFKELSTLDVVSGGRVDVGLGAGWFAKDYAALGVSMDPPLTRIARLAEAIEIFKNVSKGEPYSFQGEFYSVENLVVLPRPVQIPHQRLILGGGGKHMLTLAAKHADVVSVAPRLNVSYEPKAAGQNAGLNDGSRDSTLQKLEWIREAAGSRFDDIVLDVYVPDPYVGSSGDAVAAQRASERGLDVAEFVESPHVLLGEPSEIADKLEERRERYGISMIHVHGSMLRIFAPVVDLLAGR
jgi:probable F420-dependent oxidoreductase